MSNGLANGMNINLTTDAYVSPNGPGNPNVHAADHHIQQTQPLKARGEADKMSQTSTSASATPGYRLVTVRLQGLSQPAVEDLPVEVLPCHTFVDICSAALAHVPDAPREYGMQAFLVAGQVEVPLEHPHTPARDTLRSFSTAASLRFLVDPSPAAAGGTNLAGARRFVRVTRKGAPRRERKWLRKLARIAVGVAKFVLAVETVALVRGGFARGLRRLIGRDGWSSSEEGGGLGSGTEAVLDAVVNYVGGTGDLRALERFDPRVVRRALEGIDTEVLDQLGVPDARSTRAAVSELLQQIRADEQAGGSAGPSASAGASPTAAPPGNVQAGPGPSIQFDAGPESNVSSRPSANDSSQVREGSAADGMSTKDVPETLPGFGPSSSSAAAAAAGGTGARSRSRSRGRGTAA